MISILFRYRCRYRGARRRPEWQKGKTYCRNGIISTVWSGRRESNPQSHPPEGCALPLGHAPIQPLHSNLSNPQLALVGFNWWHWCYIGNCVNFLSILRPGATCLPYLTAGKPAGRRRTRRRTTFSLRYQGGKICETLVEHIVANRSSKSEGWCPCEKFHPVRCGPLGRNRTRIVRLGRDCSIHWATRGNTSNGTSLDYSLPAGRQVSVKLQGQTIPDDIIGMIHFTQTTAIVNLSLRSPIKPTK